MAPMLSWKVDAMKAWKPEPTKANERVRAQRRTRVLMTATIISSAGSHSVLVREASSRGAQVYTELLAKGEDACFTKGALFVAARVVWVKRGVVGLQFYRELDGSETSNGSPFPAIGDRRKTRRTGADDPLGGTDSARQSSR